MQTEGVSKGKAFFYGTLSGAVEPVYETLPDANITCLDYSPDMMERAERQAEKRGLRMSVSGRAMWEVCLSLTAVLKLCCC